MHVCVFTQCFAKIAIGCYATVHAVVRLSIFGVEPLGPRFGLQRPPQTFYPLELQRKSLPNCGSKGCKPKVASQNTLSLNRQKTQP